MAKSSNETQDEKISRYIDVLLTAANNQDMFEHYGEIVFITLFGCEVVERCLVRHVFVLNNGGCIVLHKKTTIQ